MGLEPYIWTISSWDARYLSTASRPPFPLTASDVLIGSTSTTRPLTPQAHKDAIDLPQRPTSRKTPEHRFRLWWYWWILACRENTNAPVVDNPDVPYTGYKFYVVDGVMMSEIDGVRKYLERFIVTARAPGSCTLWFNPPLRYTLRWNFYTPA